MSIALPAQAPGGAGEITLKEGGISAPKFVVVLMQLGLLALVLRQFQIEGGAFLRLALLAFAGFTVHARNDGSNAAVGSHWRLLDSPRMAWATPAYDGPRSAARMNSRPGSCSRML